MTEDWRLPKPWGEWAVANGLPERNARLRADRFRDYWLGVGGQRGVKLDWEATWRNWIRNALDDIPKQPTRSARDFDERTLVPVSKQIADRLRREAAEKNNRPPTNQPRTPIIRGVQTQ